MLHVWLRYGLWGLAAVVIASGCRVSPWSAPDVAPVAATQASTASVPDGPDANAATNGQPVAGEMQDVMAEVRRLGSDDPAIQAQLLAELQRSDPSLWPLVVESFRARLAYSRQLVQKEAMVAQAIAPHPPYAHDGGRVETVAGQMGGEQDPAANEPAVARLPAIDRHILTPAWPGPNQTGPEWARDPVYAVNGSNGSPVVPDAPAADVHAVAASTPMPFDAAPAADDWRSSLDRAIELLDAELKQVPADDRFLPELARLRLLQAAAGRAAADMAGWPPGNAPLARFWTSELAAVETMLEAKEGTQAGESWAEARRHLNDAAASLAEAAPLEVHHLAFCRAVRSFGSIERFESQEFDAGQRVLLYAEIENFRAQQTADGYHTSLRSSYEIVDALGRQVMGRESTATEDYCQRPRRDYFIGCDFRLPGSLRTGKYTLTLTVEDLKTGKSGQASIEFTIR